MTDEERPDRRTGGSGSSPDDEVWAGIVASFHASPSLPDDLVGRERPPATAPSHPGDGADEDTEGAEHPDPDPDAEPPDRSPAPGPRSYTPAEPDEHFEPPPITPSPPLHPVARLAWWAVLGLPLLLLLAAVVGYRPPSLLAWLGALSFMAGFVTLVARMRRSADVDDGDDGAVV